MTDSNTGLASQVEKLSQGYQNFYDLYQQSERDHKDKIDKIFNALKDKVDKDDLENLKNEIKEQIVDIQVDVDDARDKFEQTCKLAYEAKDKADYALSELDETKEGIANTLKEIEDKLGEVAKQFTYESTHVLKNIENLKAIINTTAKDHVSDIQKINHSFGIVLTRVDDNVSITEKIQNKIASLYQRVDKYEDEIGTLNAHFDFGLETLNERISKIKRKQKKQHIIVKLN